jgi:hypothetical protein
MQEGAHAGLTNGHVEEPVVPPSDHQTDTSTVAVEVAAMDDDAMDTTPDADTGLVLADGAVNPLDAALAPEAPSANGASTSEGASDDQAAPVALFGEAVSDGMGWSDTRH